MCFGTCALEVLFRKCFWLNVFLEVFPELFLEMFPEVFPECIFQDAFGGIFEMLLLAVFLEQFSGGVTHARGAHGTRYSLCGVTPSN